MRQFRLVEAHIHEQGHSSPPIDEACGTTYWKLANRPTDIWRICVVRHHDGTWHIWSRGDPVLTGEWLKDIHEHALMFASVAGTCEGFPLQEFDL